MLVFNFIIAPSGDEKSIAPLINPPAPIKINNNPNIHSKKGTDLFDLAIIFSFFSFIPEMWAARYRLFNFNEYV
jgi:hypothetical protein